MFTKVLIGCSLSFTPQWIHVYDFYIFLSCILYPSSKFIHFCHWCSSFIKLLMYTHGNIIIFFKLWATQCLFRSLKKLRLRCVKSGFFYRCQLGSMKMKAWLNFLCEQGRVISDINSTWSSQEIRTECFFIGTRIGSFINSLFSCVVKLFERLVCVKFLTVVQLVLNFLHNLIFNTPRAICLVLRTKFRIILKLAMSYRMCKICYLPFEFYDDKDFVKHTITQKLKYSNLAKTVKGRFICTPIKLK